MFFFQHDAGHMEAQAMYDCVMRGDLTTGKTTQAFIEALQDKFQFGPLAVTNSGTSALFLALKALGIGPGDEVITTPYVGVWTSNPILMVGATPVYADIDPASYNLDPDSAEAALSPRTKAVMPVSVNGIGYDHERLRNLMPSHVRIVADDIEALGTRRHTPEGPKFMGEDIGDDISVNGFWVSKQVTTCSGGMVTSGNKDLIEEVAKLSRHGHGVIGDMNNPAFGYNLWLPDPLAAMGIAQIERFEIKQTKLRSIETKMDRRFGSMRRQHSVKCAHRTRFIYLIELPRNLDRDTYRKKMAERKIPTRPYFNSLLDAPHLKEASRATNCAVATELSKHTVALPFHHLITDADVVEMRKAHDAVVSEMI